MRLCTRTVYRCTRPVHGREHGRVRSGVDDRVHGRLRPMYAKQQLSNRFIVTGNRNNIEIFFQITLCSYRSTERKWIIQHRIAIVIFPALCIASLYRSAVCTRLALCVYIVIDYAINRDQEYAID